MTAYDKPLPTPDADAQGYWDLARQHKLAVQRCRDCGHRHFPSTPVCQVCLSDRKEWEIVSGRGKLVSWITFHRAYWPAFQSDVPYDVCLIQLEEGPLVVSNFGTGIPANARMGLPMRVVFDDVTTDVTLARFVPE